MKNFNKKTLPRRKNIPVNIIIATVITALLLLCLVFLAVAISNTIQSVPTTVAGLSFEGEYRVGEGEWHTIEPDKHISSTKGDVTLRGKFMLRHPDTNEILSPLREGMSVSLYFNHINATFHTPEGYSAVFDSENEIIGEDACAVMWAKYYVTGKNPDTGSDILTITIHNPHHFGNELAIDQFLSNMTLLDGGDLEKEVLGSSQSDRTIGSIIAISALIVLGIAIFSTMLRIRYKREMWLIGLMSLFAGGYTLYNAFGVSLWSEPYIANTRIVGICMMMYMLIYAILVTVSLHGSTRRVAFFAVGIMVATVTVTMLISISPQIKFYDTWSAWALLQSIAAIILTVCQIIAFPRSPNGQKPILFSGIAAFASFPIDALATLLGWWEGGLVSKHVFLVIFLLAMVAVLRVIPSHLQASMKARRLEAERQELRLQLQESRISIMLSQMQPHFIFNTLNTIYHLCEINPDTARKTISYFSEYLRNNIDNLSNSDLIPFEKELSFVKTYLDIEKIRFDDELNITMDIGTTDFKLPVLTVQPLVENAVKHGISKKDSGGDLLLLTRETESCYEVVIRDTGVGFDMTSYKKDGHQHIGISSVRQRLENLCNGTLKVTGTPGEGTEAIITIPKKENV